MKWVSREIRLWLHSEFLRWALHVMPPGDERTVFAQTIVPYCQYLAESTRQEIIAREKAK